MRQLELEFIHESQLDIYIPGHVIMWQHQAGASLWDSALEVMGSQVKFICDNRGRTGLVIPENMTTVLW